MISRINLTSVLVLMVKTGVDAAGNNLYKNITLKKVKPANVIPREVAEISVR